MQPVIKIENLSKQYRLGTVGTGTFSHDLKRWWTVNVLGKEDPYLKIGETNDRSTKASSEYVWALKDINLEVMPGEVLGIIGKNGAGKSTLLKILSKVTAPTTGSIKARGRIASLLEVGTGFHPEMTGRENIYMNGAIMGMTKAEISRKLDEIIDFAGVERYIDTPVKRYSSGMTVRLGFAVAAHLEPEILVVDEVLAVGDAEFQKKAIGKMQDVSRNEGRTVLFVSHNMAAVQTLCNSAIILQNGITSFNGSVGEVIDKYLNISQFDEEINAIDKIIIQNRTLAIEKILVNGTNVFRIQPETASNTFEVKIEGRVDIPLNVSFEAMLYDELDHLIATYSPTHINGTVYDLIPGHFVINEKITLPDFLTNGDYYLSVKLSQMDIEVLSRISKFLKISINKNISPVTGVSFDKSYFGSILLH